MIRLYGLRYAIAVPVLAAIVAAGAAWILGPTGLEVDEVHSAHDQFFATAAQLIGALLVALVVEARAPFSRTGTVVARTIAASAAVVITLGGLAAVLGLSPDLSDTVYRLCMALTWAGLAAGLVSVVLLGISVVTGTLKAATREDLETLKGLGDRAAAEELLKSYDDW